MSDQLKKAIEEIMTAGVLQATISNSVRDGEVKKVTVRQVMIKGSMKYQVTLHYRDKVTHHNYSAGECQKLLLDLLSNDFKQALIHTPDQNYHLLMSSKKKVTIMKKASTHLSKPLSHNRKKEHLLQNENSLHFLQALGIMNKNGEVYPNKQNKFRQINRFVELVRDILPVFDKKKMISIVDFGCGKSYLTFALYHYLQQIEGYKISVLGLDLKSDVIEFCQKLADDLLFTNLKFCVGNIAEHIPKGKVDMVVTLHACDTATDMALEKAVKWEADVILSVPCCQKELLKQIENSDLTPLLKHGILKERFSALATDAARAQILTIVGYNAQVIEFVDTEHTPKNLMIRAIKKKTPPHDIQKALNEYNAFKDLLAISPYLETILPIPS